MGELELYFMGLVYVFTRKTMAQGKQCYLLSSHFDQFVKLSAIIIWHLLT